MERIIIVVAAMIVTAAALFYIEDHAGIKEIIESRDGMSIKDVVLRLEGYAIPLVIGGVVVGHFQNFVEWFLDICNVRKREHVYEHQAFPIGDLLICTYAIVLSFLVLSFYSMAIL